MFQVINIEGTIPEIIGVKKMDKTENVVKKGIVKLKYFILFIIISLIAAWLFYRFNIKCKWGFDNNLTGYIGFIAALPTAYLWIIRERKKEAELENKEEDQYQEKVSELNKVQIEAVNQFYDKDKHLAGAFALNGLLDEWTYLSVAYTNHKKENFIKIEQIVSILFTKSDSVEKYPYQFKKLLQEIIVKLIKIQNETEQMFDWSRYQFDLFGFGTNIDEFPGLELKYKNAFIGSKLSNATFTNSEFTLLNLNKMISSRSNFRGSYFNNVKLNNSIFVASEFMDTYFIGAKLKNAILHDSNFLRANFSRADLRGADLTDAKFKNAVLENADLRGAILKNTDFSGANLKNARLEGAIIDNAYFNGACIVGIDLNGKELDNSEIYNVNIENINITPEIRKDIKAGNLQDYFNKDI